MPEEPIFVYRPACLANGCPDAAVYKIAAEWSDGTSRELKNYGLACETHHRQLLKRARENHGALKRSDGETVGPVELYQLQSGFRDAQLPRIDQPSPPGERRA